ncbi:MAG: ribonuclease J [Clostridia bacterium]|nr:ribonuclease J [Clostridia bacterium]
MAPVIEERLTNPKSKNIKRERLKIIPLGGLEEVGKNMTVFEYGDDMILLDCGVAFPEDEMLGVDLVMPDITYLEKNKERLKAIVITHGHEDHIGSIPYVLKAINVPIYATRLTLGLIQTKLEEHKLVRQTAMKCVKAGDIVTIGNFKVEFIQSTHSIADSVAIAIHTPVGTVIHTGDFKIDFTPIDGKVMDFARLAELGSKGVLALMSDSTNSERPGYTMSESSVGKVFDEIFLDCKKRIIVATFASNIHRVQQIVNAAMENNRKVAISGRSMLNVMTVAKDLGYLDIPEGVLIDIDDIDSYAPERLVLITTGSQGETMSGLSRMASGSHKKVVITKDDLVIISAHPIPGNEKLVSNVIDDLFKIGADVIYHSIADVHVSGHACQEEQKLMLSLVKPKYFIPVHGEFRHLRAHAETAKKVGVDEENIVLLSNGKVLELDKDFCKVTGTVPSGRVLIDGLGIGDVGNIVLRDRQHLSEEGLIVVALTMDSHSGEILAGPDIISRGFVYVRESEDLMDEIEKVAKKSLEKCKTKEWSTIKSMIKDDLHDYIYSKTKRNPMVIPIISEVEM